MALYSRVATLRLGLRKNNAEEPPFSNLAELISEGNKDVVISNQEAKILVKLSEQDLKFLSSYKRVNTSLYNLEADAISPYVSGADSGFYSIIPILSEHEVLGHLLLWSKKSFSDQDMAFAEAAAIAVALEMIIIRDRQAVVDNQQIAIVDKALATLSYSELEAVHLIVKELKNDEGTIVASRIADGAGITRSVIVNALRKLESASVLKSHSLGMKGTRIKILNEKLKGRLLAE